MLFHLEIGGFVYDFIQHANNDKTILTSSILARPELFLAGFEAPAIGLNPGSIQNK